VIVEDGELIIEFNCATARIPWSTVTEVKRYDDCCSMNCDCSRQVVVQGTVTTNGPFVAIFTGSCCENYVLELRDTEGFMRHVKPAGQQYGPQTDEEMGVQRTHTHPEIHNVIVVGQAAVAPPQETMPRGEQPGWERETPGDPTCESEEVDEAPKPPKAKAKTTRKTQNDVKQDGENVEDVEETNLSRLAPDTVVMIHSLKSEAAQWMNGERGRVVRYIPASDRYEVRLDSDGSTKKMKQTNLSYDEKDEDEVD
jgi:hypothetical protein